MSNGPAAAAPITPVANRVPLAPFRPTSVAPIPFDHDITWVYVVDGQIYEATPGRCVH
jgi:hypothetical protein